MEKFELILTKCIEDIKSSKSTIADCLERYPSLRSELQPLLELALHIHEPTDIKLDNQYKQAAKTRLLQQITRPKEKTSRSFGDILSLGIPRRFAPVRMAVSVIVIVIILSLMGGGTAYASQGSLPGEILYPVKTATEDTRLFFTGGGAAKAELNLQFARTRLEEMSKLASGNQQGAAPAITRYRKNLKAAAGQISNITDSIALKSTLDEALAEIANQLAYCDSLLDDHPEYAGPVNEAASLSIKTQLDLLQVLEKQDIVQAAQINLNTMQNRLRRAQAKAGENQFQIMEEALAQYEQFNTLGEEILQAAQGENAQEIAGLSEDILLECLANLDSIIQKAPEQYQPVIQSHRESALRFQSQAHQKRQQQGNPDGNNGQGNGQGNGQSYEQGDGTGTSYSADSPGDNGQGSSVEGNDGQGNDLNADQENGSGAGSSNDSQGDTGQGQDSPSEGDNGQENSQNNDQENGPGAGGSNDSPGDNGQGQDSPGEGDNGQENSPGAGSGNKSGG